MKNIPQWLRRKANFFTLILGSLTAMACWWLLPPEPAYVVQSPNLLTVLSADLELIAFTLDWPDDSISAQEQIAAGKTSFWNARTGQIISSYSFKVPLVDFQRYERAFAGDNKSFVEFYSGKVRVWDVESGQQVDTKSFPVFPHTGKESMDPNAFLLAAADEIEVWSTLVTDSSGGLFVLVNEWGKASSIRHLLTGNEIASFDVPPKGTYFSSRGKPGLVAYVYPYLSNIVQSEVRQIPSGKLLGFKSFFGSNAISHDGKTRAQADRTITIINRSKNSEVLKLPPMIYPLLSLDGRFLMGSITSHNPPTWLNWLMRWLGSAPDPGSGIALYDLACEKEIAFFPNGLDGQFSANSERIAIWSTDSIAFYDLPLLARPWAKIAAYSAGMAGFVFLVGWVVGFFRNKIAQRRRERLASLKVL